MSDEKDLEIDQDQADEVAGGKSALADVSRLEDSASAMDEKLQVGVEPKL